MEDAMIRDDSDLGRLVRYAGKYRILIYLSWMLSAFSAVLALLPFICIWLVIRSVLDGEYTAITSFGICAVVLAILSMIVYVAALMCSHVAAFRVAANMRKAMLSHIAELPVGVIGKFGSGKIRKIVNDSSAATETYLAHQLPDKAGAIATPIALIVMLLWFDWKLGLLSLLPVALGFLIMIRMTGKRMQEKMGQYQDALADMSNQAVEYVRGIPVVKTFGQSIHAFGLFRKSIERYEKWVIAYTKELMKPMIAYTGAVNSAFAFITAGTFLLASGGITSEMILNVLFYVIITPVISITLTKIMFKSEEAMIVHDALMRMNTIMDARPQSNVCNGLAPAGSSIRLEHVTFSYDGRKDAVHDISMDIESGSLVAFVGPSGSGKTTLASLIARFFDPQSGSISIDGFDIRDIPKEKLMEHVSFVFQDSHLIKGTIRENVRLARPDASDEEVMEALRKAECMDIIGKFPDGIDTVLGTGGIYLSGGETQRIAIARTILKDSPVMILDEATAFADPDNEAKVQKAFSSMLSGRTVIMIAHRLSSITDADRIFVLADGQIAEEGSFSELASGNGLFSRMWNDYGSSVEWKVGKEAIR